MCFCLSCDKLFFSELPQSFKYYSNENKYLYVVFACYKWTTEQEAQVASLSFPEKKKICEDQGPEYKWSKVGQNQIIKLKSKV